MQPECSSYARAARRPVPQRRAQPKLRRSSPDRALRRTPLSIAAASPDDVLQNRYEYWRQRRKRIASKGGLDGALRLLERPRIAGCQQVANAAHRQQQRGERDEKPDQPIAQVVDHLVQARRGIRDLGREQRRHERETDCESESASHTSLGSGAGNGPVITSLSLTGLSAGWAL